MKNQTSKFREEDVVRVLPGVKDPDFGANIGGWSGTIEGISLSESGSWLYAIRWDQGTLSVAGDDYVDKCENENLDCEIMYLEETLLELVENLGDTEHGFFLA
jgi:hypothetical protein